MNEALRGHKCTSKTLTKEDQDQAAYTTALLATLLYWQDIKEYSDVTYRMFSVDPRIVKVHEQYRKGSSVVFPALTSSSSDRSIPFNFAEDLSKENILLVMDNLQPSSLRPRDISGISLYPFEKECLYPFLAEFKVMSIPVEKKTKEYTQKIYLTMKLNFS